MTIPILSNNEITDMVEKNIKENIQINTEAKEIPYLPQIISNLSLWAFSQKKDKMFIIKNNVFSANDEGEKIIKELCKGTTYEQSLQKEDIISIIKEIPGRYIHMVVFMCYIKKYVEIRINMKTYKKEILPNLAKVVKELKSDSTACNMFYPFIVKHKSVFHNKYAIKVIKENNFKKSSHPLY